MTNDQFANFERNYLHEPSFFISGTPACDLNALLGKDSASWALTSAGKVMSNGMIVGKVETKIQEGDIIVS